MEISLTHRVFVRYRGVVFDRAREHGERPRRGLVPAPPQKSPLPRREGDWKHLSFFLKRSSRGRLVRRIPCTALRRRCGRSVSQTHDVALER